MLGVNSQDIWLHEGQTTFLLRITFIDQTRPDQTRYKELNFTVDSTSAAFTQINLRLTPCCVFDLSRVQDLRHGQRRLHIERRALPGPQDDGGQQPEGHAAAADR